MAPRWVAVQNGANNNQVYVSTNGTTWGTGAQTSTNGYRGFHVVWFNGRWVISSIATIFYSNDPTTAWTAKAVGSNNLLRMAVGGNYIVTSYTSGVGLAYATDAAGTWSNPTSTGYTGGCVSVGYVNGYWLSANAGIRYTTNPTGTWTAATLSPTTSSNMEGEFVYGVAANGTAYYVKTADSTGTSPRIYYATDPTGTWTGVSGSFTSTVVRGLCYANGYWVAGGVNEIRYTTNPSGTWSAASVPGIAGYVFSIAYRNGLWVATGSSGTSGTQSGVIYYTTDPTGTWSSAYTATAGADYFMYHVMNQGGIDGAATSRTQAVMRAAVI